MEENFELNNEEQLELNNMPEPAPVEEENAPAPQDPAPAPAKRRKKRRKRPTWQRMLWKYWPPIRFGLIILAGILLIWLAVSSIGTLFGGTGESDPSGNTEPAGTTEPSTEPSTEPTTEPTEPPTTAPTAPPDPFAGAVSDSWYENTLFIGDFNTAGLRDNARAGNADYFCSANMGVFNWDEETVSDTNFDDQDLASLLASKSYDKIIINLGINNCGYPTSSLINAYSGMVSTIRAAQPDAKIILHGIMLVTQNYASRGDYFSPSHIGGVNEQIEAMADGETVFYVDVNESFADSNGYLLSSCSTDGCHLTAASYADWAKLMGVELGKLGIE